MNHESPEPGAAGASETSLPGRPASASRRRLLRAGAGATPVLLTLASNPVAASTNTCVVASSFISVAEWASRGGSLGTMRCMTFGVEHWRGLAVPGTDGKYPVILRPRVKDFLGNTTSGHNNKKLFEVLLIGTGVAQTGELGVLQHLISAKLNLLNNGSLSPGQVSPAYIGGIWVNFKTNGDRYVLPASNINWDSTQLITWLRLLMYPVMLP